MIEEALTFLMNLKFKRKKKVVEKVVEDDHSMVFYERDGVKSYEVRQRYGWY